jgi:hypothetical protein
MGAAGNATTQLKKVDQNDKSSAKGAEFLSPLAMLKRISGKKKGGVAKRRWR